MSRTFFLPGRDSCSGACETHDGCDCCTQNCNQGRSCPVRQACEQPEPDDRLTSNESRVLLAAVFVGFSVFCALMFALYQAVMYWAGK